MLNYKRPTPLRISLLILSYLCLIIDQFNIPLLPDKVHRLGQHLVGKLPVVANRGDAQRGLLPQVAVIHFGRRKVEFVPQLLLEAFYRPALIF